jgi:hypothetical protein
MTKIAGQALFLIVSVVSVSSSASGQDTSPVQSPRYEGFHIPSVNGTLAFSLSAAEDITLGYDTTNKTSLSTSISGNVAFLSPSVVRPFSLIYSGGYLANSSGQSSSFFQNIGVAQTFNTKNWSFDLADTLRYTPDTPSVGLSGIPGQGDIGISQDGTTAQGVLTPFAERLDNSATGSATRRLTGSTAIAANGSYSIERFLNSPNGIETNQYGFSVGATHRLDARRSLTANYSFSQSSFTTANSSFISQGVNIGYRWQWTRKIFFSGTVGPERDSSASTTGTGPSISYAATAQVSYAGNPTSGTTAALSYSRASNNGSGVSFGARTDSVGVTATRRLARYLQSAAQLTYARSVGLQVISAASLNTQSVVFGGQLNSALSRFLSIYASYSAQHQSYQGSALALGPLNGLQQTIAFGMTYSPSSLHFGGNR